MEVEANEVKPTVFADKGPSENATAVKPPLENSTKQPAAEKSAVDKTMHYEPAMTSPTELLAPESFPDEITDMNGNAMREKHRSEVHFYEKRSSTRYLLWFLIFFIVATIVMAALFTWKLIDSNSEESTTSPSRSEKVKAYVILC